MSSAIRIAAVALLTLSAGAVAPAAWAQTVGPDAGGDKAAAEDAKGKAAAAATKAFEAGSKAFEAGKMDQAIKSLTTAVSGGGLSSAQMGKALYYRGVAFRKQGKPAQAISDLTAAVWLKGGLSDADRASAMEARQAAYREAGLGDQVPADAGPGDSIASTAPSRPVTAAADTTTTTTTTTTTDAGDAAAPQPPPAATGSAWQAETSAAPPQRHDQTDPSGSTLSALPVGDGASGAGSGGTTGSSGNPFSGVGSFFTNLFGGGSQDEAASSAASGWKPAPVTTASIGPANEPQRWEADVEAAPQGKSGKAGKDAPKAAAPPAAKTDTGAAQKPAPAGKFRLQVAAVRSREEAQRIVDGLKQDHGARLGAGEPEIDEAVIGNMGTFYRVRIGPYADTNEPKQLCSSLKPQGYDCLVVTR